MTLPIQQSAAPGDRLADERFAREAYKSRSEPKMTKHTDDELIAIVGDLGARLGRGEVIGQTPYAVKCWHAITALIERAKGAERERDEAIKDRNAYAEHVLRVAAEAKDGLAALEEIDACWDAYGTTGNRMNLTLSEQIASTLRELDDERENHGNAEGELKMAEEELAQLRATPPAAPSLPADNPFEQPCYECGSTDIHGPICATCNPNLLSQSADVVALVIAGREAWEVGESYRFEPDERETFERLDKALEAFSSRVPYENDPEREGVGDE